MKKLIKSYIAYIQSDSLKMTRFDKLMCVFFWLILIIYILSFLWILR